MAPRAWSGKIDTWLLVTSESGGGSGESVNEMCLKSGIWLSGVPGSSEGGSGGRTGLRLGGWSGGGVGLSSG